MNAKNLGVAALALLCQWLPQPAAALAITDSSLTLSNLRVSAPDPNAVFGFTATGEGFAQAANSLGDLVQQDNFSPPDPAHSAATVTWANATGDAPFGFNALGFGTLTGASAVNLPGFQNVPGIQNAASSQGQGSFSGILTVTGGTGSVDVTFSLDVAGLLHGFADAAGQFGTETIAALDLDGSNVLFRHDVMSGGPNFPDTTITVSKNLTAILPLEFGGAYFLFIQADSESSARNIPEPGTLALTVLGLAGLARVRRGAAGRAPQILRRA